MSEEYFDKWAEIAQKAQIPLQKILELNLKTLKEFEYIKPQEMSHLNSPQKIIEKQMELGLANGEKTLKYMENSFKIMTDVMLNSFKTAKSV